MQLTISAIDRVLWAGVADSLTVPGAEGEMTILKGHAPLISLLSKGKVIVRAGEEKQHFEIEKGFMSITDSEVVVLI